MQQLRFDTIIEIRKFNPYHDRLGRFATSNGATSFTYKPGASRAHDLAIQRMKERARGAGGTGTSTSGKEKPKSSQRKPTGGAEKPTGDKEPEAQPSGSAAVQTKHMNPKDFFGDASTVEAQAKVLAEHLSESSGKKVTAKEADSLWDDVISYTGSKYREIREAQRIGSGDGETAKAAKGIEKFIEMSPKWDDGPLYRGMNIDATTMARFKPGQKLDNGGTSSWSDKKTNAEVFQRGEGSRVMLVLPKTKNGTSVAHLSSLPGENEILVSQKSKMTIQKVQKRSGVTFVYVEED